MHIVKKILLIIMILLGLLTVGLIVIAGDFPAYIHTVQLEEQWTNTKPKTKAELEKILDNYFTRIIKPSGSLSGYKHKLKDNEIMVQYLIAQKMPLDVVYDHENNIKALYTSYKHQTNNIIFHRVMMML